MIFFFRVSFTEKNTMYWSRFVPTWVGYCAFFHPENSRHHPLSRRDDPDLYQMTQNLSYRKASLYYDRKAFKN
jgi:hypothetical protein